MVALSETEEWDADQVENDDGHLEVLCADICKSIKEKFFLTINGLNTFFIAIIFESPDCPHVVEYHDGEACKRCHCRHVVTVHPLFVNILIMRLLFQTIQSFFNHHFIEAFVVHIVRIFGATWCTYCSFVFRTITISRLILIMTQRPIQQIIKRILLPSTYVQHNQNINNYIPRMIHTSLIN